MEALELSAGMLTEADAAVVVCPPGTSGADVPDAGGEGWGALMSGA